MSPEQHVKIANPLPGGHTHMSMSHARRLVKRRDARFDEAGRVVLKRRSEQAASRVYRGASLLVAQFDGMDAFPDRAVMPPSPEVLARMCPPRAPLRPPMREA